LTSAWAAAALRSKALTFLSCSLSCTRLAVFSSSPSPALSCTSCSDNSRLCEALCCSCESQAPIHTLYHSPFSQPQLHGPDLTALFHMEEALPVQASACAQCLPIAPATHWCGPGSRMSVP
jgi:hypothetical protein